MYTILLSMLQLQNVRIHLKLKLLKNLFVKLRISQLLIHSSSLVIQFENLLLMVIILILFFLFLINQILLLPNHITIPINLLLMNDMLHMLSFIFCSYKSNLKTLEMPLSLHPFWFLIILRILFPMQINHHYLMLMYDTHHMLLYQPLKFLLFFLVLSTQLFLHVPMLHIHHTHNCIYLLNRSKKLYVFCQLLLFWLSLWNQKIINYLNLMKMFNHIHHARVNAMLILFYF